MISRLFARAAVVSSVCWRLTETVLDRLVSVRVSRTGAIDVFASRLALCEKYDTEIHYMGASARYNLAKMLAITVAHLLVPLLCAAGVIYWTINWQLLLVLELLVLGVFFSVVLVPLLRRQYTKHLRRVFTVTNEQLISESPLDVSCKYLCAIDALWIREHSDNTVTITLPSEFWQRDRELANQLRRMEINEAHKFVCIVQEVSEGPVEVVADSTLHQHFGTLP